MGWLIPSSSGLLWLFTSGQCSSGLTAAIGGTTVSGENKILKLCSHPLLCSLGFFGSQTSRPELGNSHLSSLCSAPAASRVCPCRGRRRPLVTRHRPRPLSAGLGITEWAELGGTHRDHGDQLLAVHGTIPRSHISGPGALSQRFWSSVRLVLGLLPGEPLLCTTTLWVHC